MISNRHLNNRGTWDYIKEVAQDKEYTEMYSMFTPVPHKISRCIGLGKTAKLILIDLIGYMGDKSYCYPPIEDIALNCSMTHKTVETNLIELEQKKFLYISRNHNNTYYLYNHLHLNPYIVSSECLHEVKKKAKQMSVSDRVANNVIRSFIEGDIYKEYIEKFERYYDSYPKVGYFRERLDDNSGKQTITEFKEIVEKEFEKALSL